jgi:hypothetical protein
VYVLAGPLVSGSLAGAWLTIQGLPGEGLGGLLGSTGDIDADGTLELLAGELGPYYYGAGMDSYVLDLGASGVQPRDAVTDLQIPDPQTSLFGFRTAAGGDLDADGLEDVLIGAGYAGNASGAMYGIFGSPL